jgi:hypothetical protein
MLIIYIILLYIFVIMPYPPLLKESLLAFYTKEGGKTKQELTSCIDDIYLVFSLVGSLCIKGYISHNDNLEGASSTVFPYHLVS